MKTNSAVVKLAERWTCIFFLLRQPGFEPQERPFFVFRRVFSRFKPETSLNTKQDLSD
jgi:hypothetical protein